MKFSRRDFLQTAGIATTVALAQPGSAFALAADDKTRQPEAIAKLKSRKAEAKPIPQPSGRNESRGRGN